MSSNAKLILYKEMRESDRRRSTILFSPAERNSAQVCFLLPPDFLMLLGATAGVCLLLKPEILRFTGLSRRCRTQMPLERHRKKRTLSPSPIECRSASWVSRSIRGIVSAQHFQKATKSKQKKRPLAGPTFQRGRVAGIRGNSIWRRSGE